MTRRTTTAALLVACVILGCGPDFSQEGLGTDLDFEPNRPTVSDEATVATYSGTDADVRDAQARYRTGLDIQQKIIYRTCTPFDGVCHNRKEYPDLRTPANFLATIEAPCNLQPGDYTSVWDRCEPPADRLSLNQFEKKIDVAWIELREGEAQEYGDENKPDAESPGLHVYLREPVPLDRDRVWSNGRFLRRFSGEELVFTRFESRWWVVEPDHLMAEVPQYLSDEANQLVNVGINQGDRNRNGVFGADLGPNIPMLNPGKPEESYLIARIRGEVNGEPVPGSRMPLANQPLDIPDMLALFCFVEGLEGNDQPNLADAIDYNSCSFSQDPGNLNLLGEGVTWETRISKVLEANCGGCHGGANPSEGLSLLPAEGYSPYERLLEASVQNPEMKLVEPGAPEQSYLWLKLVGDETISGDPMPIDPLNGDWRLTEAELADINTWIVNGAIENE